ncbi:hypothetical protein HYN49_14110 [Flavobacterium pallidum]|uniref:WG repeat-containing protein n=1 Tax=Flavobacterium pallidum TaxID=2172098 RepID=A0A2S1SKL4_9FLAO|nr:hypothetical protein HYN49_14110 [Flavobacterium pallidum]
MPYRNAEKWGLCTLKKIIRVAPQYDRMECDKQFPENYFFCVKEGKTGLFHESNQIISQSNYDRFFFIHEAVIIGKQRKESKGDIIGPGFPAVKHEMLFGLEGKVVYPEGFIDLADAGRFGHSVKYRDLPRIIVFWCKKMNGLEGLFQYDVDKESITKWILQDYHKIEGVNRSGEITLKKNADSPKMTVWGAYKDKEYRIMPYQTENDRDKDPFADDSNVMTDVGVGFGAGRYINVAYKYENGKISIDEQIERNANPNQLKNADGSDIISQSRYPDIRLKADVVETVKYLKEKLHRKSGNDEIVYENYIRFRQNGKYGLVCNETVIPAVYESISQLSYFEGDRICFIVSKKDSNGKLKYGSIAADGSVIVPIIYDSIVWNDKWYSERNAFPLEMWIVQSGEKFGLINFKNDILVPVAQDEMELVEADYDTFYRFTANNKYGIVNESYGQVYISEAVFEKKPSFVYGNYQQRKDLFVIGIKNEDNIFIGYVGPDGVEFF